ncbi:MAG TPA: cytochrome c-type biogenesis protein CcmH [Baekduia sp.]|nr:cytochrome c-type biogenesis protein CcmH [Baekduia sp.]
MRRLILLLAAALVVLAAVGASTALAATPRTALYDVEDEVMCVSCGVPLAIAESPQADAERREIQRLIDKGLTKSQVKASLVDTYGDRVLAKPKDEGFGRAAYLVPIGIVLAALIALVLVVPRWRRRRAAAASVSSIADIPRISDADARRLDADLARYDL